MFNQNRLRSVSPQKLLDKREKSFPLASSPKHIIEAQEGERVSPLVNWTWHLFFKPIPQFNKHWFLTMKQLNEKNQVAGYYHGALLTLLGSDLRKVNSGQNEIKPAILQNDASGDLCYQKQSFFSSVRDHEFNEEAHELTFSESGITLNISDLYGSEAVTVADPKAYFS